MHWWASIPVVSCMRCGNDLLKKEIDAKKHHCAPCEKLIEAARHNDAVADALHKANRRHK